MSSKTQNPFHDIDMNTKTMDEVPLVDPVELDDNYEPQHQYQEPNEEVERQLKTPTSPQPFSRVARKPVAAPPHISTEKEEERRNIERELDDRKKGDRMSGLKGKAKEWFEKVKNGEMEAPWTNWYCCGVVNGKECDVVNNRLKKECKRCKHRVCENCVKEKL